MNYKEEMQKLLLSLKELGYDRRSIEKDLDYHYGYIDKILSKGGNKKIFQRLEKYLVEKSNTNEVVVEKIGEAGKEISDLRIKSLETQEIFNVLIPAITHLSAESQEKEFAEVFASLHRAIDSEFERLKNTLKESEQKE